VYVYHIW